MWLKRNAGGVLVGVLFSFFLVGCWIFIAKTAAEIQANSIRIENIEKFLQKVTSENKNAQEAGKNDSPTPHK